MNKKLYATKLEIAEMYIASKSFKTLKNITLSLSL